jgi:LPXTG-motif cell wall-anchored protein
MPHHHARHVHLHARQGAWDQFTSAAGKAWDDVFPTGKVGNKANDNGDSPATIYRTVYTTKTPDGWTGTALTTLAPADSASTTTVPPQTTSSPTTEEVLQTASASLDSTLDSDTGLPTVISSSSITSAPPTLVVAATTSPSSFSRQTPTTTAARAESTTGTSNDSSSSSGPSTGAKAGIAIGVLGAVLVVFVALYFLFTRRRKQMDEQRRADDDEKRNGPFADSNAIPGTPSSSARAPRLSLRPVTQFLPNLGNQAHPDRRASRGAAIAMTMSATPNTNQNTNRALTGNLDPPSTSSSAHSANPFGNDAARMYSPIPEESSRTVSPISPIESDVGTAITTNSPPRTSPAAAASNATMAAGAAAGLTRKTSLRKDHAPKPLDLTKPMPLSAVPPSPAGTEFSMRSVSPGQSPGHSSSAAAIAAAGGPPQSGVHRVQLDFKPTLEDELELRAGQLVRLLHEYDDGWVSSTAVPT